MEKDFIGIKVGDVNESMDKMFNGSETRSYETVHLNFKNKSVSAGELFTIDLIPSSPSTLSGFQFDLNVREELAEIVNINSDLDNFGESHYNRNGNQLKFSYTVNGAFTHVENSMLQLQFLAKTNLEIRDVITLNSAPGYADEWYNEALEVSELSIQFSENEIVESNYEDRILYNKPNPFSHVTYVNFMLSAPNVIKYKVYNTQGKVFVRDDMEAKKGSNQIALDAANWPAGLYYIEIDYERGSMKHKMLVIK
jgi:hypothetical protein